MFILERKKDTKEVVGIHSANIRLLNEWGCQKGIEAIEITENEYNQINIAGLTKLRFLYDKGLIDN